MTWALALEAVIKRVCGTEAIDLNFSSSDFNASIEFIVYCRQFADAINKTMGYDVIPVGEWTKETAKFSNGSRIFALSSDPKVFRGRKDEVILDEFAFNDNQGELFKAAQPLLILKPDTQLTVVSTHDGPETMFNNLCRQAENGKGVFTWHRTTLEEACNDGFALRVQGDHSKHLIELKPGSYTEDSYRACNRAFIDMVRASCATEEDYEQEYNCCPAKYSCLVRPEDYDALVWQQDGKPVPIPEDLDPTRNYGELYVGIDCGRVHDFTVVWVIEKGRSKSGPEHLRDVYRTVCVRWMQNTEFPVQEQIIRPIVTHPSVCGGFIDIGAVGRGLADSIIDETGDIVEGFAFTAPRMAKAAEMVRQFVQQKRVTMHPDSLVRSDVLCVRKTQSPTGQKKYGGSTKLTHGDFFWALALALESANKTRNAYLGMIDGETIEPQAAAVA